MFLAKIHVARNIHVLGRILYLDNVAWLYDHVCACMFRSWDLSSWCRCIAFHHAYTHKHTHIHTGSVSHVRYESPCVDTCIHAWSFLHANTCVHMCCAYKIYIITKNKACGHVHIHASLALVALKRALSCIQVKISLWGRGCTATVHHPVWHILLRHAQVLENVDTLVVPIVLPREGNF